MTDRLSPTRLRMRGLLALLVAVVVGMIVVPVDRASAANMDIGVSKRVTPTNAVVGDVVAYTVVITNIGANAADAVVIKDLLPSSVTYSGYTASAGTYVSGTGLWSPGTVAVGASRQLVITGLVNSAALGYVTNTASFNFSSDTDINPNNNTNKALFFVAGPDLGIGKSVNVARTNAGGTVIYSLAVTNFGPMAASGVTVNDLLPAGITYASDSGAGAYVPSSGVWTVGALTNNQVKTLSITATVNTGTVGLTINNVATVNAVGNSDTNTSNQSASAVVQVPGADLGISIMSSTNRPMQGSNFVFTVTVTNAGPDTATNVVVSEPVPFGVTYVSHAVSQGTYTPFSGMWDVGALASGATATLSITNTVSDGSVIQNTAAISNSSQPDSVSGNNRFELIIRPLKIFPAGAAIIDMGVIPQTVGNGLKPYGLLHDLMVVRQIPVWWIIDGTKTSGTDTAKVDTYDVVISGKQYKGGPFVIEQQFIASALATIKSWTNQGVRVDFNLPQFTAPVYGRIESFPNAVLDLANGSLIKAAFYTKISNVNPAINDSYIIGTPADLNLCDDIYVMPHASPEAWTDASGYKTKLLDFVLKGGYFWAGCHAVSSIETLVDVNGDGVGDLNFLTDHGLWPDALVGHANNSQIYPMPHDAPLAGNPYMQFMGTAAEALVGGAEDVYLLKTNYESEWRPTTSIGIWDPNQADLLAGTTHGKAALLAWGRAFGNPDYGMVMYESSHDIQGGTEAQTVAAARIYGNFLLEAGLHRRARVATANFPTVLSSDSGQEFFFSMSVNGGTPPYRFAWTSSAGGTFTTPDSSSTYFTAPVVSQVTEVIVRVNYIDACGRENFYATVITVYPPGGLKLTKQQDRAAVQPGGQITYTLGASFTNMYPNFLTNARIEDRIPSNTTYVANSATTNGTYSATSNLVFWTLGSSTAASNGVYMAGSNLTLTATADTYISDVSTTANYGSLTTLAGTRIPTEVTYDLVQFTLPAIPTNAVIATARFSLFAQTFTTGQTFVVHALTPVGSWTETGATWLKRDSVNSWFNPGGDYSSEAYATLSPIAANQYASADIGSLIRDWAQGTYVNRGLLLEPLGRNGVTTFSSREHATVGQRPKLELFYYTVRTENDLSLLPMLAANGATSTVTMTTSILGSPDVLTNSVTVTPPASLIIDATGDASAVLVSGPSPANAVIPPGGGSATFTYQYRVLASTTPSTLVFRGTPTSSDPNVPFVQGKSNNGLVAPPLKFTVNVLTNLAPSVTQILNQASFQASSGFLSSNTVYSGIVTATVVHAGLTVTKTWTSPSGRPAAVGETVRFNIAISNNDQTVLSPIMVTDLFNTNIAVFSSAVPSPDTVGSGSLTWTNLGTLGIGKVTNVVVNLIAVGSTGSGSSTNFAVATGGLPFGLGTLPPTTGAVPYRVSAPAVSVSKSVITPSTGRPAAVGERQSFRIWVTNTGDVALNTVPLTDTFNTNLLAIVSQTPSANATNLLTGTLSWTNIGPLAVGASTSVVVRFTALVSGIGTNVVVTAPSTTNSIPVPPATNSVPHVIVNPVVGITKSLVSPTGRPAAAGETVQFAITAHNLGDVTLDVVPVTDAYNPTLLSFVSALPASTDTVNDGFIEWTNIGPLAPGSNATITVNYTAAGSGLGTNVVVTAPTMTNGVPVAAATSGVPYAVVSPGVLLNKRIISPLGRPVLVGEDIVFGLTVTNTGNIRLDTVPLVDTFDTNLLSIVSQSPGANSTNLLAGMLIWTNVGPLAVGGSVTVTARFTSVTSGSGVNFGVTSPTTTNGVPVVPSTSSVPHKAVATVIVVEKQLQSPTGRPAMVGEELVFSLLIANQSEVVLDSVPLTDTFNTNLLQIVSQTPPANSTNLVTGTLTWTNVGPVGISSQRVVIARFKALASGTGTNVAIWSPSTTNALPIPPSTSSVPHSAVSPRFAASKTLLSPAGRPAAIGEPVIFTISVTNTGDVALGTVALDDTYDSSILDFDSSTPQVSVAFGNQLSWNNVGPLAVGGSTNLTVYFTAIGSTLPGVTTNTVISTTTEIHGVSVGSQTNRATAQVVAPVVAISKVVTFPSGRPAAVGETNVFTVTVSNTGDTVLDAVPVTDSYNTNLLRFVSATPAPSSNALGRLTWNSVGPLAVSGAASVTSILVRFEVVRSGTGTNVVVTTPTTTNGVPVPPATNSVPHTGMAPSVRVTKTLVSPAGQAAQIGEPVVFRITVTNTGDVALDTVPVEDVYELNFLTYVNAVPPTFNNNNDGRINWVNVGPLAVGASTNLTATFMARAGTMFLEATNTVMTMPTLTNGVPVVPQTNRAPYVVDESIAVDNVSTGAFKFVRLGLVPHTVYGSSTNHLLVVGISVNNTPEARGTVTNVTYAGINLTLAGTRSNDDKVVYIWTLTSPPVGAANVVAQFNRAPGEGWVVGVMTLRNVDQEIPYGAFASSIGNYGNPTLTAVASAANEVVVDAVALQCTSLAASGLGQTQRWTTNSVPIPPGYASGGGSTKAGAASVDLSWTATYGSSTNWAMGALAIRQHRSTSTVKTEVRTAVVQSSLNPSTLGQAVTFTAIFTGEVGTPPTGTVQFMIDGTNFGSQVTLVDGTAVSDSVSDLAVGAHTVTAVYPGDVNYSGSSPELLQTVGGTPTLVISAIRVQDGHAVVEWPGTSSWFYTVLTTPSLSPLVPWSNLLDYVNMTGLNGTMSATDTNSLSQARFYRVKMNQ